MNTTAGWANCGVVLLVAGWCAARRSADPTMMRAAVRAPIGMRAAAVAMVLDRVSYRLARTQAAAVTR